MQERHKIKELCYSFDATAILLLEGSVCLNGRLIPKTPVTQCHFPFLFSVIALQCSMFLLEDGDKVIFYSSDQSFQHYFNKFNNYYYYYYFLFSQAFSVWYFSWTSGDPHRSVLLLLLLSSSSSLLFVFVFMFVLFTVLCYLCLYVALFLTLATWLLTQHVNDQEVNWTELNWTQLLRM
jgi:hypothetical protein